MKRMLEKQFDDDLFRLDLLRQSSQAGFVFIGRRADRQLFSKLFCQPALQSPRRLVV